MVGRGLQAEYYREPLQTPFRDEVVLEAEGLGLPGAYRDVAFKLHEGEILGIAGVIGSGREELTRTLAGFAPHDAGQLASTASEMRLATPADAVDHGIGYLPRERRIEGLVLFLSVAANITLADLRELRRFGAYRHRRGAPHRHRLGQAACASRRRASTRSASASPAATSRRSCWPNGCTPSRAS